MAKDLFNRYIWLVDTIYRAGKITFEEINERWLRNEMSSGEEIPLRTFHNHRQAIEEMFDINIECNKRGGYYYYIENTDDIEKGGIRSWLLNTFAVNNLINESHNLKRRILFENIPSGQKYLTPIIEAMRDNQTIEITYQSYWKDEPHTFDIEPYCVKVFKQRWYVIARSPYYDTIRIYALDRIRDLQPTDTKFNYPKNFDPQHYFDSSFGIIVDTACAVERVQIKVYGNQTEYIRALPLHHSQREIETEDDYSVFEYTLRPTYDFHQEILAHGMEVEVLSPTSLRKQIAEMVRAMNAQYME
ncbi:MAG: WYL domain-containing protein [Tannerellaceae bacterium]|jgi:hypothetical protein|nr:WYL domain-containing protein [Tannerellaceae bacterium]